jgi:hypothetical protein
MYCTSYIFVFSLNDMEGYEKACLLYYALRNNRKFHISTWEKIKGHKETTSREAQREHPFNWSCIYPCATSRLKQLMSVSRHCTLWKIVPTNIWKNIIGLLSALMGHTRCGPVRRCKKQREKNVFIVSVIQALWCTSASICMLGTYKNAKTIRV